MDRLTPLLGKTLVLVAHPDDEAAGCGVLLQRIHQPIIVFATDGAPRDSFFWKKFGSRDAYGQVRRDEARQALAVLGIRHIEFLHGNANGGKGGFTDQELFRSLETASEAIKQLIEQYRPAALLTLAYEGGHPDHDACSFLGCLIARDLSIPLWEFPLYHRSTDGLTVRQRFSQNDDDQVVLQPTQAEIELKRRMLKAYMSQAHVLKEFQPELECFRPQPKYDYSQPPQPGTLNYEAWQWPVTGPELCAAFSRFLGTSARAQFPRSA
jgi:LmbE family N-acetylglucosaminyl deacetylase